MFDLIRKIFQTKTVTKKSLFEEAPASFRGKPVLASNECTGCGTCVQSCPSGAIDLQKAEDNITISLSYANCIFCGICAEQCETDMIQATNLYRLATKNKSELIISVKIPVKSKTELLSAGKGG